MIREHLELYEGEIPLPTVDVIKFLYEKYYEREKLLFTILKELKEVRISEGTQVEVLPNNENLTLESWHEPHTGDTVIKLKEA